MYRESDRECGMLTLSKIYSIDYKKIQQLVIGPSKINPDFCLHLKLFPVDHVKQLMCSNIVDHITNSVVQSSMRY